MSSATIDAVLLVPAVGRAIGRRCQLHEVVSQHPAGDISYRIRRVTAREDLVVVERSVGYDGGPWMYGVQLLAFRGDKLARERIHVKEGWEAP